MHLEKEQLERQAYVIDKLHKKLEKRFDKKIKNSKDKEETFKKRYLNKIASHIESIKKEYLQSVIGKLYEHQDYQDTMKELFNGEEKNYKLKERAKEVSHQLVDKNGLNYDDIEKTTFNFLKDGLEDLESFIAKFNIREKKQLISFATILLNSHEIAFIAFKSMEKLLIMDIHDDEDNQTSEQNLYKIIGEDIFEHIQYKLTQENKRTSEWENDTIIEIGSEIFGVLEQVNVLEKYEKENSQSNHYKLSEEFEKNAKDIFTEIKKFSPPFFEPMIVIPRDWTTLNDGGFLRNLENDPRYNLNLVKTTTKKDRENLKMIETNLPIKLLDAINILQRTKWQINKKVLSAIKDNDIQKQDSYNKQIKQIKLKMTPLNKNIKDIKQKIKECDLKIGTTREALKEVNIEEEIIHQKLKPLIDEKEEYTLKKKDFIQDKKKLKKRKDILEQELKLTKIILDIASKYQKFENIYFVWQIDFRGRAYPVQPMLNSQGDDISKSLLHFSIKKPLGKNGLKWFKIHGANLYGEDKISFQERIEWINQNKDNILNVAHSARALEDDFLKKADKKYQFLAFCYEYADYIKSPSSFQSSLPIAIDGSNNGFQHITTLLHDIDGAKKVNVLPTDDDKPADIYKEVAEKSKEILKEWIKLDSKEYQKVKEHKDMVNDIVDNIDRDFTKKNVMTDTYGAGKKTKSKQIKEYLEKKTSNIDDNSLKLVSEFFALANDKAIDNIAPSSAKYKKWIKKSIDIALEKGLKDNLTNLHNHAIYYKTPIIGLVVIHEEFQTKRRRIVTKYENKENRTQIRIPINKIDKSKIKKGIAPNFIHSLDATHLYMTVLKSNANGISSFSTVHDSFATHASDIEKLGEVLREEFINLHKNSALEYLKNQFISQYNIDTKDIPKIPFVKADFNIEEVKNAKYFFA